MLFDTFEYWIFFALVATVFYLLPFRIGKLALLGASYVFYMWWDVRFVALILTSTLIDFALGLLLERAAGRRRKVLLIISLVVNLGILGFFKYYNFFATSLADLLRIPHNSFVLQIVLPVGISFYTFASLSYTIDVYWGKIRAVRNLIDYAFFIAFFPHLVAGPIIRAKGFLPQIQNWTRPSAAAIQTGLVLALVGLIKKVVFADRFAIISDGYFNDIAGHPGWLAAWSAATAFAMQLFFDFSGYTDIARGCAKLLGFEFPLNFTRPYLATNVVQFWSRWHITLAAWVRDYLFLPMVRGTRRKMRIYGAIAVTMVLVGVWHGASWNFVAWGAYMGVVTVLYRVLQQLAGGDAGFARVVDCRFATPLKVLMTFACFAAIGAVIFRTASLHDAITVVRSMFAWSGAAGESVFDIEAIALLSISFVLAVLEERLQIFEKIAIAPAYLQVAAFVVLFATLELFPLAGSQTPFLYFQF